MKDKIKYNFTEVEKKWAKIWYEHGLYKSLDKNETDKPKKYILVEFPYPNYTGLHMGHIMRYGVPDVLSRKFRMSGYNVLFPMGWDAFGLPTENYAIKTGQHPKEVTKNAIAKFKKQLISAGFSFDWTREFSSTDPEYYKWTQWMFLKFYEHGLAEIKEMPIWWCDELKTVLSNEEVIKDANGNLISERGEKPVEKRMLRQWVIRIDLYAEKLLEGLEENNFPESIKAAQRNWIGKSEGARVKFQVEQNGNSKLEDIYLETFTTRIDTIFGVSFLVLAPEHELVKILTSPAQKELVEKYIDESATKSDLDRVSLKEKTGVFTGSYAINPFNSKKIPIFVGDYVLNNYGTGAVMGVPAHDERDNEFAKKYNLEILNVVEPINKTEKGKVNDGDIFVDDGILVNSGEYTGMKSSEARERMTKNSKLAKDNVVVGETTYKLREWVFSRQRYWGEPIPMLHDEETGEVIPLLNTNDTKAVDSLLPLELPEVPDYQPSSDSTSPLAKNKEWVKYESKEKNKILKRETNTMPNWAGSSWYYLRYIDPKNNKSFADMDKLKYMLPVDMYFGGSEHTTLHLLYSRFWHRFLYDLGLVPTKEPYTWRMNSGLLLGPDGRKMSKSIGNIIDPDESINKYGGDATKLAVLFLGPYDGTFSWKEGTVKATNKLINNIYNHHFNSLDRNKESNEKLVRAFHLMLKNITNQVDQLKVNTAISEIMIFVNKIEGKIGIDIWTDFIKVLAILTPFLAEELWFNLHGYDLDNWKKEYSVHMQGWPEYNPDLAKVNEIIIGVQINGKRRGEVSITETDSQDTVLEKIKRDESISKWLEGKETYTNVVYIPNKIINIVL